MSNEEKEWPGDIAKQNFNKFRVELGVRSNNEHVGSGLGGNPTEFWFVLNHNFKLYVDNTIKFQTTGPNEVTAWIPGHKEVKLADIRKAFSEFIKDHPDKIELDDKKITNPSFLKDLEVKHSNASSYIRGVEKAHELAHWLDMKKDFMKEVSSLFHKEILFLETQFLKEMGLPENYLEEIRKTNELNRKNKLIDYNDQNRNDDPYAVMFKDHPVWGARTKAARDRQKIMDDAVLSQEDKDRMEFLGSLPSFIAMQVIRSIIGIERIVSMNLDESWDALGKINQMVR